MPEHAYGDAADQEIDLRELWGVLWRGKWVVVAMASAFSLASIAYALLATEWFRADVLLTPAEKRLETGLTAQLGGLAALAGVSIGKNDSAEPIAVLKSRTFARAFVNDLDLLKVFFYDKWDQQKGRWHGDNPRDWPDSRDAVEYFHENVMKVSQDRKTGLVTLSVEWKDPDVAAFWAETLSTRLNARIRERALKEAETNVAYLQSELAATNVVTLQQSIGRLLEVELQKLMLARGNEDFAFKIVDPAEPPRKRVRPKRVLIVVMSSILGGILGIVAVLLLHLRRDSLGNGPRKSGELGQT